MPEASADLRRLRLRTGVKTGQWAEQVNMHRTAYIAVENGRRPGSAELFARCANLLTNLLGDAVEADDLISKAQAEGATEAPPVAAVPEEAEALNRGVA